MSGCQEEECEHQVHGRAAKFPKQFENKVKIE